MEARQELIAFYRVHNPAKLKDVDALLEAFRGREAAMMSALREKYGVSSSPHPTPPGVTPARAARDPPSPRPRRTERMLELLSEMGTVDLSLLAASLASSDDGQGEHQLLVKHITVYVEHIAKCAAEFLALAGHTGAASTPVAERSRERQMSPHAAAPPLQRSSPSSVEPIPIPGVRHSSGDREVSASSPSPPSVARTDAQDSSPLASPDAGKEGWKREGVVIRQPPSPPPPPSPTRSSGAAAALPAADGQGKIYSLMPEPPGQSAFTVAPQSGDCVELQPGLYYESISLSGCGAVELTAAYPGSAVVLRPCSEYEPILRVSGRGTRVRVRGLVFVVGDVSPEAVHSPVLSTPTQALQQHLRLAQRCPLVCVEDGAELTLEGCHVYNGGAGGATAVGAGTTLRLHMCLVSLCVFAGVYAHGGADLELLRCHIKQSECGIRAADSGTVVRVVESTIDANSTDGVIVHGAGCRCTLERSGVSNSGGSGLYLGKGGEARLSEALVELNAAYGVHRSRGSRLHLQRSVIRDNTLAPINEERA